VSKVTFNHVSKTYEGNVRAVRDVSFSCEDGEFLAILGPSGSGKSSMLRMIAGLEEITRGEILFDEKVVNDLTPSERNLALAFESYALYPLMSVYDNIAFPLQARGLRRPEVDKKVRFIAEALDLMDILKKKPSSLSGGHQQRVSLARALVREPNVTLLDEPISHMDQRVRAEMRARIRRLHDELHLTTIYVTHDQAEAVSLCDRLVVMNFGELQQIGTVDEIWNQPANKFVATFVGEPQMNFINGKIETPQEVSIPAKEGKITLTCSRKVDQQYIGSEITIGFRPQQITISLREHQEGAIAGSVELIEFQGENAILTVKLVDIESSELKAVIPGDKPGQIGDSVWLRFSPEIIHLFHQETAVLNPVVRNSG
jgi:multiple sugar transport system ATP-binding protein